MAGAGLGDIETVARSYTFKYTLRVILFIGTMVAGITWNLYAIMDLQSQSESLNYDIRMLETELATVHVELRLVDQFSRGHDALEFHPGVARLIAEYDIYTSLLEKLDADQETYTRLLMSPGDSETSQLLTQLSVDIRATEQQINEICVRRRAIFLCTN